MGKHIQFFVIYNDEKYPVVASDAKTVTILDGDKTKKVPQSKVTKIGEPGKSNESDLLAELDSFASDQITDEFNPSFDRTQRLEMNVGQNQYVKFLQLSTYEYDGEQIEQLVFRNPFNGYTYHLSGKHSLNWFKANGEPGEYYQIQRLRDMDTGQVQPMKCYRYTLISDAALKAKLDARMSESLKNFTADDAKPF